MQNTEEKQYLEIIKEILEFGDTKTNCRNGTVKSLFGVSMKFDLRKSFPLLTTKKLPFRIIAEELLWFISGSTDNKVLNEKKIHIWDDNASVEFMQAQGLDYRDGLLGPIYSFQWRYAGAEYDTETGEPIGEYVDQLQELIDNLKDPIKRYSRRLVINSWNVKDINKMSLPPCHVMAVFNVTNNGELNCMLSQRSGDMALGVPFNIASYSLLTCLLAHHCGLKPGVFFHTIADAHIYEEHFSAMNEQLLREPFIFPELEINGSFSDINQYTIDNFSIREYQCHDKIKMKMVV